MRIYEVDGDIMYPTKVLGLKLIKSYCDGKTKHYLALYLSVKGLFDHSDIAYTYYLPFNKFMAELGKRYFVFRESAYNYMKEMDNSDR